MSQNNGFPWVSCDSLFLIQTNEATKSAKDVMGVAKAL